MKRVIIEVLPTPWSPRNTVSRVRGGMTGCRRQSDPQSLSRSSSRHWTDGGLDPRPARSASVQQQIIILSLSRTELVLGQRGDLGQRRRRRG